MDVKKSYNADLENKRTSGFLIGLVVVLSLFLAALEFTTRNAMPEADDDILDDIVQDIEMTPVIHQDDIVAATRNGKSKAVAEKLNIVDERVDDVPDGKQLLDINNLPDLLGIGVGGVTDIANTPISLIDADTDKENPLNFQIVEQLPEFPGGMSEFVQWLTKNLKYPTTSQRLKRQGTVLVSFIINKDGSTSDHKVVKSAYPDLDREALRVLKKMPRWKPGEDKGKPCRTYFCIPIVFKL